MGRRQERVIDQATLAEWWDALYGNAYWRIPDDWSDRQIAEFRNRGRSGTSDGADTDDTDALQARALLTGANS